MVSRELRDAGRHALIESLPLEFFGPLTLLVLRQMFVHQHPTNLGPFVNWSLSLVMLVGDSLLVIAVAVGIFCSHDLKLHGDAQLLPVWLGKQTGWLRLLIISAPLSYLGLVRADPFRDQLALQPHAWIFQAWHVVFGAYIGARLASLLLQGLWSELKYCRHHARDQTYCPPPPGRAIGLVLGFLLVVGFGAIFLYHPPDYHLTTPWLHFG